MTVSDPPRIAVVMSRFPKFTETFVVNEILAFERHGVHVHLFPLLPEQPGPHQPKAAELVTRAEYGKSWGPAAALSLGRRLVRQPRCLAAIVARLVADTVTSPTMLMKDLILLPRICEIADRVEQLPVSRIHAHFLTHGGFAAWALSRMTGLPYSVVAHGSDVHRHKAMMKPKVAEADFVATVSDFNRQVIEAEVGGVGRVEVIRCGIDLDGIEPLSDRQSPGADPLVVCVGTLHEVKGQRYAIEAVAALAERGHRVRLDLVGDGPDRAMLEQLAADLGIGDQVTLTGPISHDKVIERYQRADVLVAPSVPSSDGRREGIPTVIMEAMATGTPVVASDLSGIPELVDHGETGLLAPPGDSVALADAIEKLMADPALAERLAHAAERRVRSDYDVDRTTARLIELMAFPSSGVGSV